MTDRSLGEESCIPMGNPHGLMLTTLKGRSSEYVSPFVSVLCYIQLLEVKWTIVHLSSLQAIYRVITSGLLSNEYHFLKDPATLTKPCVYSSMSDFARDRLSDQIQIGVTLSRVWSMSCGECWRVITRRKFHELAVFSDDGDISSTPARVVFHIDTRLVR